MLREVQALSPGWSGFQLGSEEVLPTGLQGQEEAAHPRAPRLPSPVAPGLRRDGGGGGGSPSDARTVTGDTEAWEAFLRVYLSKN